MAAQRFGQPLVVNGTDTFRQQAVQAGAKLKLVLADPALEKQRQALLASVDKPILDAAAIYIAERNDKRAKGINILPHRRYEDKDSGMHAFAGLRFIKDQPLMLLQTSSEMLVLSIDDATANRCQRLSVGHRVEVNAQGKVRGQGRKV